MIQNTEPATWHIKHLRSRTAGQRMADKIAKGMGSWKFIVYQTLFIIVWMILNLVGYIRHWDPYPFILLNLIFSTQAAYAAPIIVMAQNRQAERDRVQAKNDYDTNIEAKKEIEALQLHLSKIEVEKLDLILKILQQGKTP